MSNRRGITEVILIWALASGISAQGAQSPEVLRWEQQARNVTIIRDTWGVAHIYGKTDADAVFGAVYAQGGSATRRAA